MVPDAAAGVEQGAPPCVCLPGSPRGVRVVGYLRGGRRSGLDCEQPLRVVCCRCTGETAWVCGCHRSSKCGPCSARYKSRLTRIAQAGVDRSVGHVYMLTITAPGDRAHDVGSTGRRCPCTPEGGVDLARWNPTAAKRWANMLRSMRRATPGLEYLRCVELQVRGALHLHVIVCSPTPLTADALRPLAIVAGFGHELDLAEAVPGSRRFAYYVSKYATKACDTRDEVPWVADVSTELVDKRTGEITVSTRPMHTRATHRNWSSSRTWGLTMAEVRAAVARNAEASRLRRGALALVPASEARTAATAPLAADSPPPG